MKLLLNLKNHCIEIELKRIYNSTISSYFKNPSMELEKQIEILEYLLTHLDFPFLRTKYRVLAGGTSAKIWLSVGKVVTIEICEGKREKILIELTDHKKNT